MREHVLSEISETEKKKILNGIIYMWNLQKEKKRKFIET